MPKDSPPPVPREETSHLSGQNEKPPDGTPTCLLCTKDLGEGGGRGAELVYSFVLDTSSEIPRKFLTASECAPDSRRVNDPICSERERTGAISSLAQSH